MSYYTLFKMSVKTFVLNMPEWDKPEEFGGLKVMKSRTDAFVEFKKGIIEWLKDQKKIDKTTADDQIKKLEDQYKNGGIPDDPFIQNLTNIPGAVTKIESRTSPMFGSGDIRTITNKDINTNKNLPDFALTFTEPTNFNETMRKYRVGAYIIDNYGSYAGKAWGSLFPKEKTKFLITFDSSKIPAIYKPEDYPLLRGGRRKSRKIHKKRYSRRVASRKYRNRK